MKSRHVIVRHPRKKQPVLWVIDSEQWPRACLRAELIERGYDPYGFITMTDALDSLSRPAPPNPEAIIVEWRGKILRSDFIEAIRNLKAPKFVLGENKELKEPLIR